jgi:NodT family efflux transporter outer membrane factor (OMF) lipoprotein
MRLIDRCNVIWPILTVFAIMLSSCTKVGPDYVRPEASISPNWLDARDVRLEVDPAKSGAWWEVFNDPVLNRLIERAYHDNLSLKIAGVRVLEARAQLGITVGFLYPQTQQASGSVTYNRIPSAGGLGSGSTSGVSNTSGSSSSTGSGSSSGFSYWRDQVGLDVAWEIDFWGRFRRAIESDEANLLSFVADYDSTLVSLIGDVASYYVQIRTLEKRLEIAWQNLDIQRESLRIAESRFTGGVSTERDVEQAKTLLFNTQAAIPTLEAQLQQAKNALSVLLGLPPGNLADILAGASGIPAPPPTVAVGIPADLLRRRPDVRSAELQAVAQSAQIGVAKADLFPAFSLNGSFGFVSTDAGRSDLSDMFRWSSRLVSTGPAFQWNILNYGRITNNVRLQDARFQELLITYQNTVLQAQQEVENYLAGFLRAQENADSLSQSAQAARRSLDLAVVQYQQGSTDFTTVLTAQQALLTAQDSFATALGAISGNLIGVYRALGGGWEIRVGDDIISPEIKEVMERRTNWGRLLAPAAYMPPASELGSTIRAPDW